MSDVEILRLHDTLRLIFDENIYTSNHHVCCSKIQGSEKKNGTLAGVPHGCTKPLPWHSVSSANQIPQQLSLWKGEGTRHQASYSSLSLQTVEYFRTSSNDQWLTIEILAIQTWWNEMMHVVRESGSLKFLWQNVSILWNKISIIMSCFLQSCATVINEPRFSFVDCESGEYHFTGAGGYSLVYSCAVHLTTSHK